MPGEQLPNQPSPPEALEASREAYESFLRAADKRFAKKQEALRMLEACRGEIIPLKGKVTKARQYRDDGSAAVESFATGELRPDFYVLIDLTKEGRDMQLVWLRRLNYEAGEPAWGVDIDNLEGATADEMAAAEQPI